ncbi:MAG: beta-ketoacyl-ACP synthase III [Candidatus Sericytochromatia bacterium]|nr:beta-ketoacyl-ACP synthase III [Candidatus Sericytochromatia bacterium]
MVNHVKISGMGKYLPERLVTSEELEKKMGLTAGWSYTHSGVKERHFVNNETCSFMGARALELALKDANMKYEDLDAIIGASGSFDHPIPYNSCLIQKEMDQENSGTPCWDIDSTCLSFVTAFDVVSYLIEAGKYKNVAIVTSEISSKSLNYNEKESATLLGDGAAAAIISKSTPEEGSMIIGSLMETYSRGAFYTSVKGGGNTIHPNDPDSNPDDFTFNMKGRAILEMAFDKLPTFLKKLFVQSQVEMKDLTLVIPHQASKLGIDMAKQTFGITDTQLVNNLANHGNCIAASIPMALHDALRDGRAKRGDKICLIGTSAGLSLGGIIFVY